MSGSILGKLFLEVYRSDQEVAKFGVDRVTEIGRQQAGEPVPYTKVNLPGLDRIILTPIEDTKVSRKHLRIEPRHDGGVVLFNASSKNSIPLLGENWLAPGESRNLELPVSCEVGDSLVVRLCEAPAEELQMHMLQAATYAPGHAPGGLRAFDGRSIALATVSPQPESEAFLFDWLQASMDVFQSAATSAEFLSTAARAAVKLIGLDLAKVLLYRDGQWSVAAVEASNGRVEQEHGQASQTMLRRVLEQRRTFYQVPLQDSNHAPSLLNVQSFVAAPFLDQSGQVLGVLYGERRFGLNRRTPVAIRELDAKFLELLAYGVASGLARIEQEKQLIAERVRFEQFFSPQLAQMLEMRGDEMLAARDAEVSVLFCDIKGFSRISCSCGATTSVDWVCDVLSELSDCVVESQGVLVDYAGDAIEAMWGAPLATADHASLACQAAMKMRSKLPAINARWQRRLGEATDISIGINSGTAQVGNIGSRRKYKYGALGTTVNLASRIQGATKYLGPSVLASAATIQKTKLAGASRRLCTIRTVNIIEPVEVYELCDQPTDDWSSLKLGYEQALFSFENQEWEAAGRLLAKLVQRHPQDLATQLLLDRIEEAKNQPGQFDSVWKLDGK